MAQSAENTQTRSDLWHVAIPYGDRPSSRTVEFFEIEELSHPKHLRIRATRSLDLLDLTFELVGIGFNPDRNRLEKYDPSGARLTVIFPPQHIAETIHPKPLTEQGGDDCCAASEWGQAQLRPARESRLEFSIPDPQSFVGDLSIAKLTDWAGLELEVDDRARAEIGADAKSQLEGMFPGIDPATLKTRDLINRLSQALQAPKQDTTELELVRDLVFSPSQESQWALPEGPGPADPPGTGASESLPLWTARIEGQGRRSLRAIHSRLVTGLPTEESFNKPEDDMSALTLRNHWDIVAQTSIYGLPALLKLNADGETSEEEGNAMDVPPPSVVSSPVEDLAYLEEHLDFYWEQQKHRDVGLALAHPFRDADVNLSALGAVMDINWAGDPARVLLRQVKDDGSLDPDQPGYTGFNLERLSYKTFLGRDSRVEAVEKGFLLPLGIRASLLTICERKIYADKAGADGQPVSHEVRRRVIFIPPKVRRYPGPYQFDDGRAFPASQFEMLTRVTPDLVEVENFIGPLPPYSVFWPKVASDASSLEESGVHFPFEWATEDAKVKSNLLFVINSVASRPDLMAQIKREYNKADLALRKAHFGGARQRYAKPSEETPGDTSFDTNHWILGAQGRMGPDGSEVFFMDGRMEGADQPGIYPVMEEANINVQSVDQILGSPQGAVDVTIYEPYRLHGFKKDRQGPPSRRNTQAGRVRTSQDKPTDNAGEIFLEVTKGSASLASGGQTQSTGGLASPQAHVAAISRTIGLVGGTRRTGPAVLGSPYDFSDAAAGNFNPKQFFSDANLLGIIDLGKILDGSTIEIDSDAVPQLKQVVEYGAGKLGDFAQVAAEQLLEVFYGRNEAGGIAGHIRTAKSKIETRLKDLAPDGTDPLTFRDLVGAGLEDALGSITDGSDPALMEALKRLSSSATVKNVQRVIEIGENISRNVASFIDDPVPELAKDALQAVADLRNVLESGTAYTMLQDYLRNEATQHVKLALCEAIDAQLQQGEKPLGPILFGPWGRDENGDPLTCEQIFANPGVALLALKENMLSGAFDRLVDQALPYLVQASDLLVLAQAEAEHFKKQIDSAIREMFLFVADKLEPFDAAYPDLRAEAELTRLRDELLAQIDRLFADLVGRSSMLAGSDPMAGLYREIDHFERKCRKEILDALTLRVDEDDPARNLIRAKNMAKINTLLQDMGQEIQGRFVKARVTDPLRKQLKELGKKAQVSADQMVAIMEGVSQSAIDLYRTSALHDEVKALSDVIGKVRASALALLEKGMGQYDAAAGTDEILAAADELEKVADQLLAQSDWRLKQLGTRMKALAQTARVEVSRADTGLRDLVQKAKDAISGNGHSSALLDPLGEAMRLRLRLIEELRDALGFALADETAGAAHAFTTDLRSALAGLARALLPGTASSHGDDGWDWSDAQALIDHVRSLNSLPDNVKTYADDVQELLGDIARQSKALSGKLKTAGSIAELQALVANDGVKLASLVDRKLAGELFKLTELPQTLRKGLELQMRELLKQLWQESGTGTALGYLKALAAALESFNDKYAEIEAQHPEIARFLPIVLGGEEKLTTLKGTFADLTSTITALAGLADNVDPDDLPEKLASFFKDDLPDVEDKFRKFSDALAAIRIADAGQVLMQELRGLLDQAERELRNLLRSFVPTQLTTSYNWHTDIGEFPRGKNAIYRPRRLSRAGNETAERQRDLKIEGTFNFDFMNMKSSSTVVGKLAPFDLVLLTEDFLMATISFKECTFTSVNGSKPDFDVQIDKVELGKMLKFLEPLQEWLSPEGSGFYLKPTVSPPGIEAGYIYDAGLIQLGSLQFINVNFGVAAKLPFDGSPAKFGIALANARRPFMVANPPYGGGGWLFMETDGQGFNTTQLSIFFGGVSAIRFGPLDAQGRIVAGLYVDSYDRKVGGRDVTSSLLLAFFEAVGSGSIACFSISVTLRVQLVQTNGGAMYGSSTFTFKFKVGWVKYKYSVKARYKIKNGKGPSKLLEMASAPYGPTSTYTIHMYDKARRWKDYRKLVDTSLATV